MKIIVDIQALQSAGSKGRGIGRYTQSIVEELLRRDSPIMYDFLGNGNLSASSLDMSSLPCRWIDYPQGLNSAGNQLLIKTALASSDAEAVFFPSPVEGTDATIPDFDAIPCKVFAICYDLIPLHFIERYFPEKANRDFYLKRLNNLRHANLIFAISEATRQDTIEHLHVSPEKVINISSGVSCFFRPVMEENTYWRQKFAEKFNITHPFVMYTGGDDWRKNMGGLVEAFGRLPQPLRDEYQLVIACKLSQNGARELTEVAARHGFAQSLVLTNYVTDEEMRALYSTCALFVFPSLYEGFGLPVLEAMACGAPVLAGNNSSLPEIIGNPHQLFDSSSTTAIAASVETVLRDEGLRNRLASEAPQRASMFTWEKVAQKVEHAILQSHQENPPVRRTLISFQRPRRPEHRTKVAFFSPLRPVKSGIADYSENLLPELRRHIDIDLYHDKGYKPEKSFIERGNWSAFSAHQFEVRATPHEYDTVIYQLGNSEYHTYMYPLLMKYGGISVLHDYYLGGLLSTMVAASNYPKSLLFNELSHSYGAVKAEEVMKAVEVGGLDHRTMADLNLNVNRRIFTRSLGVIVHNRWAYDLAVSEFQSDCENIVRIPLATPRVEIDPEAQHKMRQHLNIPQNAFLVAAFGMVDVSKRPTAILNAFQSYAETHPTAHLVFVGDAQPSVRAAVMDQVHTLGVAGKVHVTGFVGMQDFCRYIQAADICLNLRFPYNGETSAALLQLFAYGKPVVVTDIGSFSEFPDDIVVKIPTPTVSDEVREVYQALTALADDPERRETLGRNAAAYVAREHSPERCAKLYADFVQLVMRSPSTKRKMLADYVGREAGAVSPAGAQEPRAWLAPFARLLDGAQSPARSSDPAGGRH